MEGQGNTISVNFWYRVSLPVDHMDFHVMQIKLCISKSDYFCDTDHNLYFLSGSINTETNQDHFINIYFATFNLDFYF